MTPALASRHAEAGSRSPATAARAFELALLAAALGYLLLYLVLACYRVPYLFQLEWLEGGVVHQAQRILEGRPLYAAPSLEFIPLIYTPLFSYLSAAVCSVTGLGFPPVRMISLVASLGCFALIFLHVRRETRNAAAALAAAGLYAATFQISGAWFDTARVDSLFLFFLLWGIHLARFGASARAHLLAGVILAMAYLTKQAALGVIAPVMLSSFLADRRRSPLLIGVAAGIILGSTVLLDRLSDGWYRYYLFDQPALHGLVDRMWIDFWTQDIAARVGIAGALAVFAVVSQLARASRRHFLFYLLVSGGMLATAWASRLHFGGYTNVLMPAYAWIAVLFGIALEAGLAIFRRLDLRARRAAEISLYLVCLLQFALLLYDPLRQIPTRADLEAGHRLLELFEETEGEILIPSHNFLPALVGKKIFLNNAGMAGILSDRKLPESAALRREVQRAIRERRFALVVTDGPNLFADDLRGRYRRRPSPFGEESRDAFWPLTGMPTRPEFFYVPEKSPR